MSRFQLRSNAQWELIADQLPKPTGRKGRPFADAHLMVKGDHLPVQVWDRLAGPARGLRCLADSVDLAPPAFTWEKIQAQLQGQADAEGLIDWTVAVDSTAARAHQHATSITRDTGSFIELQESLQRAA